MKYTVWYNNNVEVLKAAEFGTFEEAKAFCDNETAGYDKVSDGDTDYDGLSNSFCFEVYEGEPIVEVFDDDGEIDDEKTTLAPVIYCTEQFYCK